MIIEDKVIIETKDAYHVLNPGSIIKEDAHGEQLYKSVILDSSNKSYKLKKGTKIVICEDVISKTDITKFKEYRKNLYTLAKAMITFGERYDDNIALEVEKITKSDGFKLLKELLAANPYELEGIILSTGNAPAEVVKDIVNKLKNLSEISEDDRIKRLYEYAKKNIPSGMFGKVWGKIREKLGYKPNEIAKTKESYNPELDKKSNVINIANSLMRLPESRLAEVANQITKMS